MVADGARATPTTGRPSSRPCGPLRSKALDDRVRLFLVDEAPHATALPAVRPPPLTELVTDALNHSPAHAAAPRQRCDGKRLRIFATADAELLHPLANGLLAAIGARREMPNRKAETVREEDPILVVGPRAPNARCPRDQPSTSGSSPASHRAAASTSRARASRTADAHPPPGTARLRSPDPRRAARRA